MCFHIKKYQNVIIIVSVIILLIIFINLKSSKENLGSSGLLFEKKGNLKLVANNKLLNLLDVNNGIVSYDSTGKIIDNNNILYYKLFVNNKSTNPSIYGFEPNKIYTVDFRFSVVPNLSNKKLVVYIYKSSSPDFNITGPGLETINTTIIGSKEIVTTKNLFNFINITTQFKAQYNDMIYFMIGSKDNNDNIKLSSNSKKAAIYLSITEN
jgi:hypothetical protein